MKRRTVTRIVICCAVVSFVSWLYWGYKAFTHVGDPLTWGYAIGSGVTILGPLLVALLVLACAT